MKNRRKRHVSDEDITLSFKNEYQRNSPDESSDLNKNKSRTHRLQIETRERETERERERERESELCQAIACQKSLCI